MDYQGYPTEPPNLAIVDPMLVSREQVQTLTKLVQDIAKTNRGQPMLFDVSRSR